MSRREIDQALAGANPVGYKSVKSLEIGGRDDGLLDEILAGEPQDPARPAAPIPARRRSRWARPRYLAAIGGAAVAVAVVLIATGSSGVSPEQPAPAYGAELVRFAETSPLLLMGDPGWQVSYADERSPSEGELDFQHGPAPIPVEHVVQSASTGEMTGMLPARVRQRRAELNWQRGPLQSWVRDRAASAEVTTTAPVLGTTAQVFQYEGGSAGDRDITALWSEDGGVLEFRSAVPDMATFKRRLASLRHVDAETWLDAMPASLIQAADHGSAVAAMLKGIPLPPGFDPEQIPDAGLNTDRYQLGAAVSGAVAFTLFMDWAVARRNDDQAGVAAAIAALASASQWPVLREMSSQGAYGEVLEEFAAAMPSGEWAGRPLIGDVNSGLGCAEKGVQLSG
jgi:hypothetical protein